MTDVKLPARLSGKVRAYKGNGRKLGYPTANIDVQTDLKDGVYFGFADMAGHSHHPAILFIGTPTTVGDTERRIEAHLLDIADRDYYGQRIDLSFEWYHRSNRTFGSVEELRRVMHADEQIARQWFADNARNRDN